MTLSVLHNFQSAKGDGDDPTLVQPSHWNDEHELTAAANTLLGVGLAAGPVGEVTCTQAARNLLDDPTVAAMQTTLNIQPRNVRLDQISGIIPEDNKILIGGPLGTWIGERPPQARVSLGLEIGVDVQAWDAQLQALSGLTPAADRLPYYTGVTTAALTNLTPFARTLLDDIDAAAARTTLDVQRADAGLNDISGITPVLDTFIVGNGSSWIGETGAAARQSLGLAIGVNIQAYDQDLAAIALAGSGVNKLPYYTNTGVAAITDLTVFARTLLDDTTQAAMQATLGIQPGTNTQPYDADLAALAAAGSGTDKLPYYATAGVAALTNLTLFGRSLIDDNNSGEARTTLGLAIGVNVQAANARLNEIVAISPADNTFYVGNGAGIVAETGATARTSLGISGGGAGQLAHCWGCVKVTGGVPVLAQGINVASIIDTNPGEITVTMTIPHGNAGYAIVATCDSGLTVSVPDVNVSVNSFLIDTGTDTVRVGFATFGVT